MDFWRLLASSYERAYASQISLLTKQTLFIHLFVFCSFAPSPQKYKSIFCGPLTLKSQNFDEIVFFSAGSEKSQCTRRTLRFWPNNRRKRQLFAFCLCAPFPHGYIVSRGVPGRCLAMT